MPVTAFKPSLFVSVRASWLYEAWVEADVQIVAAALLDEMPFIPSNSKFLCSVQSAVSAAVLPLWADPELAATSPEVAQRIVSIMTKCINGTSRVTVPSLARAGIRAAYQPDAGVVQQIVEMGFSAARAEEALRRVRFPPAKMID